MHKAETNLQRYLDGEFLPAQQTAFEQHLLTCEQCRQAAQEYRQISAVLQTWTLPPALTRLSMPVALPAPASATSLPGLWGWLSGGLILLLYFMLRIIFNLYQPLNLFLTNLGLAAGAKVEILPAWPLLLAQLFMQQSGQLGAVAWGIFLPLFLYSLTTGAILSLYAGWMNLSWFRQNFETYQGETL